MFLSAMFIAVFTFAQNPEIKPESQARSVSFGGLRVRSSDRQ